MNVLLIVLLALFSGCSTKSDIVKQNDGTYIARATDYKGIFGSGAGLMGDVSKQVNELAAKEGKQVQVISDHLDPVAPGKFAWYEMRFRLINQAAVKAAIEGCYERLKTDQSLQTISNKIALAGIKDQSFSMLANKEKPTGEEKLAIAAYADKRKQCDQNADAMFKENGIAPATIAVIDGTQTSIESALVALYDGKITYGEFAQYRKQMIDSRDAAIAKIEQEYQKNASEAAARAQIIANETKIAQAQQTQAFASIMNASANTSAASAMMMQANRPVFQPMMRNNFNCTSNRFGNQVNTSCY
jgi:hypothetical protein